MKLPDQIPRLAARAGAFAAELHKQGVVRGDRVVIFLHNSPEAVIAVFGTLLAGGVFSVVNPGTKADKLAYILNHCTAKALVTEPRLAEVASSARELMPWNSSALPSTAMARRPSARAIVTTSVR